MRNLTKTEKLILQEASRIKRSLRGAKRVVKEGVRPSIGYTTQEMWEIFLRRLREGDTDSALVWYDHLQDRGVSRHSLDSALATDARVAPARVPMASDGTKL